MAGHGIPHFQNDGGHRLIQIGVKEFMCTGASVPYDHPHIYIDMGDDGGGDDDLDLGGATTSKRSAPTARPSTATIRP